MNIFNNQRNQNEEDILRESLCVQKEMLELLAESCFVQKEILSEVKAIHAILKPKQLTHYVAIQFTGVDMADNALVLNVGQTSQATIAAFLADGTTLSGGVPSNVVFTFSDQSATVVLNADGVSATVTGVQASTGAVSGSATFAITDTDGVVSQWNQAFTVTTNAVAPPPQQLTQSVAIQFSAPTP